MAKKNAQPKKNDTLVGSIILTVLGIIMLAFGADYLWVLFGVIEIPLQIVGAVVAVIGALGIFAGVKKKKKKQAEQEEQKIEE